MPILIDDFRSHILRSPTNRKRLIVGLNVALREAEIGQFDIAVFTDEDVLRFKT